MRSFFWGITLCHGVIGSEVSKALRPIEILSSDNPTTQRQIPLEW